MPVTSASKIKTATSRLGTTSQDAPGNGYGFVVEDGELVFSTDVLATLEDLDDLEALIPDQISPGGSTGDLQYNNGGVFAAAAGYTYASSLFTARKDGAGTQNAIVLQNFQNASQAGAAIAWYHLDADGTTIRPSARITGRRWSSSDNFGELVIEIGSNGSFTSMVTLDANGILRVPLIFATSTIVAGSSFLTGLHYGTTTPTTATISHGLWAKDGNNVVIRSSGFDLGCFTWNKRMGLGIIAYADVLAKLHILATDDLVPTQRTDGIAAQTKDLHQWNPNGTTAGTRAAVDAAGCFRLPVFTDATRPAAGSKGRMIWNDTDAMPNFDNGSNWVLADGTVT